MKTETIADIVAKKRHTADDIAASAGGQPNQFQREMIADLRGEADRIEAAHKREDATWRSAVLDFCDVFTMVYEPPFKDCPAMLSGAFLELCDKLGIEQVKIGDGNGK